MALRPVQLFSQDPGFIGDFSGVGAADIFNNVIAARVNRMEEQFAPPEEEEDALDDQSYLTPRDLFATTEEPRSYGAFMPISPESATSVPPPPRTSTPAPAPQTAEENYNAPVPGPRFDDPADFIFNSEARRGKDGKLQVYQPPSGDGGGAFEVAGITARYQPQEAAKLRDLIGAGRADEAEAYAKEFYRKRAAPFTGLTQDRGLQLQFADAVHHRGEGGLRRILQRATGSQSKDYGELIGTLSGRKDSLESFDRARREYEWEEVDRGRESRKKFRKGLENRFDKAAAAARQFRS